MRIELLDEDCMPEKKHMTDAGYDLKASNAARIDPGSTVMIGTGVKFAIPPGYCGVVVPRSSMGKRGGTLKNTIGILDSDYRGEVVAPFTNTSQTPIDIEQYERFVQILFVPVFLDTLIPVYFLDETNRGEGGFGSTGR